MGGVSLYTRASQGVSGNKCQIGAGEGGCNKQEESKM